jgi:hypothetical protein
MPAPYRLHLVYFGQPPAGESDALALSPQLEGCMGLSLGRLDAHSTLAARWCRDPMDLAPQRRIALELLTRHATPTLDSIADNTDAALYLSETHRPVPLHLNVGDTHPGTLLWSGSKKRPDVKNKINLKQWFKSHISIIIYTQQTDSYSQHRAQWRRGPVLDGIAEETFPLPASQSEAAFFNA